ncbi:hypothetical protein BJ964_008406 [Actinoplanes lobatus]|uniref:Uncharacterized protein n=1 Tax=Actinoplanes lobatus TaxID=113568 RepID=A0A7W7MLL8_9ACTN|nr:hypothetical protein [Actinoplanes lobatus]
MNPALVVGAVGLAILSGRGFSVLVTGSVGRGTPGFLPLFCCSRSCS